MPLYRFGANLALFIHVPKTGGSSIESAMRKAGGRQAMLSSLVSRENYRCTPQHLHADVLTPLIPMSFTDYRFMVCRHPVDRMVSEYKMRQRNAKKTMSFEDWVANALRRYEKDPYIYDNHIRPQNQFLDKNTEVFRFESGIDVAVAQVFAKLDLPTPSPVEHRRGAGTDKPEVSETTRALVEEFYVEDFKTFGY